MTEFFRALGGENASEDWLLAGGADLFEGWLKACMAAADAIVVGKGYRAGALRFFSNRA
jgi:hypothetical protein